MRFWCLLLCSCLFSSPGVAHEVRRSVGSGAAVVVTLTYGDGQPFAFEAFEVYPEGESLPWQVGRTDRQGRAIFAAGVARHYRLKAYSADGHGVDLSLEVPAATSVGQTTEQGGSRISRLFLGLSLLIGGFGVLQLWLRKKS